MKFMRKVVRIVVFTLARFDPVICGKVVRIAAAISAIEFLLTLALAMLWIPADSRCHTSRTPEPLLYLGLSAGPALWLCVIAIFWKYIAVWIAEYEKLYPRWLLYPYPRWISPANTAIFTAVFVSFAAFSALPFFLILQECR
jgi:hypothetical protein